MNPEISGTWTSFFPNLQFARNYSTDSLEANPIEISLPIVNVSVTGDEFTSDGAATVGSVATVTMSIELPEGTSVVQKEPSEEALRKAHFERMEESLEPITDDQSEENSE